MSYSFTLTDIIPAPPAASMMRGSTAEPIAK